MSAGPIIGDGNLDHLVNVVVFPLKLINALWEDTLRVSFSPVNSYPIVLASIDDSFLNQ